MIVGFIRASKFALQNFFRNMWLSLVTVFIMTLTLLSITLVVGLNIVGSEVVGAVQEKVDTVLYFHQYADESQLLEAQEYLRSLPEVLDVTYISKEAAEQDFRERRADDEEIIAALDELDKNIFQSRLVIVAKEINSYPDIIKQFEDSDYAGLVETADYSDNQRIIDTISSISDRVYQVGIGISTIFIAISIVVIFNTFRIAIYNHREEVGIMKLVGATNWFVRAPFILESVFLAILSALITVGIFYAIAVLSNPALSSFFVGYDFSLLGYVQENILLFIAFEILGAAILSILSSMFAIGRYLRS